MGVEGDHLGVVTPAPDRLAAMLDAYVASSPAEQRDVDRVRDVMRARDPWDRTTPLHVTASALVVHEISSRVLLRWHERQQSWLQVGGHADPGESDPFVVAVREASEETGLVDLRPVADTPIHVVIVPVPANDRETAHEHADVRFVLATDQPDSARAEHASAPLRWLTFDEAHALTSEDNVRESLARARARVRSLS